MDLDTAASATIQGLLSGLAVFLAAWLQNRAIRRQDAAALARQQKGAFGLLMTTALRLDRTAETLSSPGKTDTLADGSLVSGLVIQQDLLRAFPVASLQDPAAIDLYIEAQTRVGSAVVRLQSVCAPEPDLVWELKVAAQSIRSFAETVSREVDSQSRTSIL